MRGKARGLRRFQPRRGYYRVERKVGVEEPPRPDSRDGVSNNTRNRWHNPAAELIGYRPQDNAEAYASEFNASPADGTNPAVTFHGGEFCDI